MQSQAVNLQTALSAENEILIMLLSQRKSDEPAEYPLQKKPKLLPVLTIRICCRLQLANWIYPLLPRFQWFLTYMSAFALRLFASSGGVFCQPD